MQQLNRKQDTSKILLTNKKVRRKVAPRHDAFCIRPK
jgi:hypothetical protein